MQLTGNSGGIVHISVSKNPVFVMNLNIFCYYFGHFFALVALVTLASPLFVTELMVQLRSEFVGILGTLLPISYASECGEMLKSEESVARLSRPALSRLVITLLLLDLLKILIQMLTSR